jgi:cytochrome c biogenesis protein CcmG/thiol:disulfide interchange protein DsbE
MKNKFQKFLTILLFLGLLFLMVKYLFVSQLFEENKIGALLGKQVPYFQFKYADNDNFLSSHELNNVAKEYKLINFFASWCSTCLIDHEELLKLQDSMDVDIIGVIWRDSYKAAKMWLFSQGNPYDILLIDNKGKSKKQFKLIGVPESFLLDPDNNVVAHYRGPIDADAITKMIDILKNN